MSTPRPVQGRRPRSSTSESYAQAETLRDKSLEFGRQFAELSLDVTEKAVHQGADLYLKAVDQVPVQFVKEVAKVQTDWTLKATDLFVRQGRQLAPEARSNALTESERRCGAAGEGGPAVVSGRLAGAARPAPPGTARRRRRSTT